LKTVASRARSTLGQCADSMLTARDFGACLATLRQASEKASQRSKPRRTARVTPIRGIVARGATTADADTDPQRRSARIGLNAWGAADVMTRSVVTKRSTDGIRAVLLRQMLPGIGGARVELGGTELGYVTLMDLNCAALAGQIRRGRWWNGHRSIASGTVADVISIKVDEVRPETLQPDVLDVMVDRNLERVLVLEGRVVGVETIARAAATGTRKPRSEGD
jgi:CBS domain-containing protein